MFLAGMNVMENQTKSLSASYRGSRRVVYILLIMRGDAL